MDQSRVLKVQNYILETEAENFSEQVDPIVDEYGTHFTKEELNAYKKWCEGKNFSEKNFESFLKRVETFGVRHIFIDSYLMNT